MYALTLSQTSPSFQCLQYKSFENTVGKGEIARNEQFLLFPQCFLYFQRTFPHFHQNQNCRLQTLSVWETLKIVVWERVKNCRYVWGKKDVLVTSFFLFFPQCFFLTLSKTEIHILSKYNLSFAK